ncbi:uncharacterized protein LOC131529647 isoform X2 [Onychostoma macrolepis]|uniref:uncharacterized protein LOC131529647 isoform X2 n=1 Tax=Onychostoma macrolepis TaxID=369639 RepID=UPI00272A50CD|nr:uncharacterized protein LOC131529647 isoform X2 [Onychostoma macrolepis]
MKHISNLLSLLVYFLAYGALGVEVSVFVIVGDSVTLHNDFETNPDWIRWDFHDIIIAQIRRDRGYICTDDQCNERFRDRLELDHLTGSLTIMNTRTTDSGDYQLRIAGSRRGNSSRIFTVVVHGFSGVGTDDVSVSVTEGDSLTLHTDVEMNPQDRITWYFNETIITEITGDLSFICTNQCNFGDGRFRDRLKLDQTGSLTITNTRTTDSGLYDLLIKSNSRISAKVIIVYVNGVSERVEMKRNSVKEGESVTLDPGVIKNPNLIMWYFKESCIAEITGDQSKICTDDLYKERFRDRLKLDHQTGSLTIMNTRTTDSGYYQQQSSSSDGSFSNKTFVVVVHGFFSIDTGGVSVSVMEGDSVTLHTDVKTKQQEKIRWYFNETRITQISGDLSFICTDVQCNESTDRIRDRLKLDHQTGSLTIINTRTTDSGVYQLKINNSINGVLQLFSVVVHDVSAAEQDEMKRKSVQQGESVTLDPGVIKNPNDFMTWYFNDICIAEITGDQIKICTDDLYKERLGKRARVKLDHQTGSLTIMNTRTTDSGVYQLEINSSRFSILKSFSVIITDYIGIGTVSVSVMEGFPYTLQTGVKTKEQETIRWYFNDTCIAQITGDLRYICTGVQCNSGNERFRDRLILNHQTGSLTITNIRITDSGEYELKINNNRFSEKTFMIYVYGFFHDGSFGVLSAMGDNDVETNQQTEFVTEGDSVTLHTGVKTNQQKEIIWYFNNTVIIAVISGDLSFICTDVQCEDGDERFRDRLKLDHQTGSLTIMNIRTTDSGLYKLQMISSRINTMIFIVTVQGLSAAKQDEIKVVKEGESITLDSDVEKIPNIIVSLYHNSSLITEITGDPNKTCIDDQCEDADERFRDRLKVNQSSGSLTITNTRTTDSGLYKLKITRYSSNISISSFKSFSVNVTAVSDSGLSSDAVAGICAAAVVVVLVFVAAAAAVVYNHRRQAGQNDTRTQHSNQANGVEDLSPNQSDTKEEDFSDSSPNKTETEAANETLT